MTEEIQAKDQWARELMHRLIELSRQEADAVKAHDEGEEVAAKQRAVDELERASVRWDAFEFETGELIPYAWRRKASDEILEANAYERRPPMHELTVLAQIVEITELVQRLRQALGVSPRFWGQLLEALRSEQASEAMAMLGTVIKWQR